MSTARYGSDETRQKILDVSRSLIEELGTEFNLATVAKRAGVSRQTVYLHFGDRTKLLVALVRQMDDDLDLETALNEVFAAETGQEMLLRLMTVHSWFTKAIDPVALVLEASQNHDPDLGEAWRDRMNFRRAVHHSVITKIEEMGELADGWTVAGAADLVHAITLPGPWRELTDKVDWADDRYIEEMARLLQRALLSETTTSRGLHP
jgi:AcrR family transcriptional regulator